MLAITTAAFDASMFELCLPLWCGGCVEIVDEATRRDPSGLIARINNASVSVMFGTPATWQMLIARGWLGDPTLKIVCGGETLSRDLADKLLKCGDEVWNIYGQRKPRFARRLSKCIPGRKPFQLAARLIAQHCK